LVSYRRDKLRKSNTAEAIIRINFETSEIWWKTAGDGLQKALAVEKINSKTGNDRSL